MTTTPKYQVGQTVLVGNREETIVKVGRSLIYVTAYGSLRNLQAFYIESGYERRSSNAGGIGDYVLTLDEAAERERRREVVDRLTAHGFRDGRGWQQFAQSTEVLERVLVVLDEAAASEV